MEKDNNFSIDDKGKGNYIIRSSGTFEPEKYIMENVSFQDFDQDEYLSFVENAISMIYDSLLNENKETVFHTVGLWITFEGEDPIENAIDVSVLESIAEFGEEGVIPILEFAKMTLDPYYESEVSS